VEDQDKLGKVTMIASGNHHNLILNNLGVVFGWGNNDHYQILPNQEKKEPK
jgi:alpha-tubulin suppressor-like RCC1 family protein